VVIGTQGSYSAPPALIALKDLGNAAELLWEKQVDGPVATSPAFLPDGQNSMFYVASGNGVLYRIRWDGFSEEDWKVNLGSQVNNCSPVIDANGLVFIGTGAAKLLAYAPDFVTTSLPVKTFQAGSAINATPAIGSTGNLYVGTQNGMYYAIDITQDSLIADWIYDAKVPFAAPALVTETGVVVNGATNGDVFLFADPDFHPATEQTYKAYWPTFLGNNKRSKVATMTLTSIPEGDALPKTFALNQNYPNPFNPKTVIGYSLPKQSQVELKVYDILGMEVAVLVNQMQPAGNYTVDFDGVSLPSGVYFYQIKTNEYSSVKKMMLLK
ncbi:partial Desiccation/radiation resistance protein, partial [Candidatus Brocadiaceae bacterium]